MKDKSIHLQTAKLLLQGIEETLDQWPEKTKPAWGWAGIMDQDEKSKESVIRRCVQARQEILMFMKELK